MLGIRNKRAEPNTLVKVFMESISLLALARLI
jgi:hypothetical protein